MKTDWQHFLQSSGAEFQEDTLLHFGNPVRELQVTTTGSIMTDLSHLGLLHIHGEDAASFMQNLLSNDIKQVDDQHSQLSALCSPKGRILALFRIFRHAGAYYLQLPADTLEAALKRLRMYVLSARVEIEDASDTLVRIGFTWPDPKLDLEPLLAVAPQQVNETAAYERCTLLKLSDNPPRYEAIGELEDIKKIWHQLDVHAAPVGPSSWRLLDIQDGIPNVYQATMDAFVPQMVNLESLNALCFTKGCYPGQEVIARAHYLGKVKRQMYLLHCQGDCCPAPGDTLINEAVSERVVGKVVDASAVSDGGCDMLAVIQSDAMLQGHLQLAEHNDALITVKNLPYSID